METIHIFDDIRQRCGDRTAISPEAERILNSIIQAMARDYIDLYLLASSTRTAQKVYFATLDKDALVRSKALERQLDQALQAAKAEVGDERSTQETMSV